VSQREGTGTLPLVNGRYQSSAFIAEENLLEEDKISAEHKCCTTCCTNMKREVRLI
jgi:hypothetical protein